MTTLNVSCPTPADTWQAALVVNRIAEPYLPVGRLAPSPTGLLHLGHARTFLLAFWHIRARGGLLRMRIEDLDGPRVQQRFVDAALRDLEWLGLEWDGSVCVQSDGQERLDAALAALLAAGSAYACVCSRADVRTAQSAPHSGAVEPRYPGTCRGRFATLADAVRETGREAGVRLIVPPGKIVLEDGVCGERAWDVATDVGDFLIARRSGATAYQLAVVVDDAAQGVTEVLRGEDLLPSSPRQWHIQAALGLAHPAWFHVPLVVDPLGRRLAKSADDLSLSELRARGVDPRAVVSWAARTAGFHVEERVTASALTSVFALEKLSRSPAAVTPSTLQQLLALA